MHKGFKFPVIFKPPEFRPALVTCDDGLNPAVQIQVKQGKDGQAQTIGLGDKDNPDQ